VRKYRYAATAGAMALLTVLFAGTASAAGTTVLTGGSIGGAQLGQGETITISLKSGTSATFYDSPTGTTGIRCGGSSGQLTVIANPAAPGTATLRVTSLSFSACTENIPGASAVTVGVVLPLDVFVSSTFEVKVIASNGGAVQVTLGLVTTLGTFNCIYLSRNGSLTGTASNTDNSVRFSDYPFDRLSGASLCFSTAFFSASYIATSRFGPVFVN
jgi:hypothetical protein